VIEALEADENPCAFFFFDRRDDQLHLQSFDSLICSITYQLCLRLEILPDIIMKTYSNCGSGSTRPSHVSLQKMLIEAIKHLSDVVIVIDALDESHEIAAAGSWLRNLANVSSESLHVLITSRDIPLIYDQISPLSHETVRVDDCTAADIKRFITKTIANSELRHWPSEFQLTIRESLYERADGM